MANRGIDNPAIRQRNKHKDRQSYIKDYTHSDCRTERKRPTGHTGSSLIKKCVFKKIGGCCGYYLPSRYCSAADLQLWYRLN